jgi:hypothetical protein
MTTTDADGRYEFSGLPAGNYGINASKSGFLPLNYGQTKPSSPPRQFTLAAGEMADSVDLFLLRGGVITGRVVDDFGEPISGALVGALRSSFRLGQRRYNMVSRATTNDIGEYRLFNLTPGAYIVNASVQAPPMIVINGVAATTDGRDGLGSIFYPGAADVSSAAAIAVVSGQTIGSIDLALTATRLSQVSGIAVDLEGRPLAGGSVSALPMGPVTGGQNYGGQLLPDGTFIVAGLPPGQYRLRAMGRPQMVGGALTTGGAAARPTPPPAPSIGIVTVNGNDVSSVLLSPPRKVLVQGRVTFSDPAAASAISPPSIRIAQQPLDPDEIGVAGPTQPSAVKDDFTFELELYPGLTMLRPIVAAPPTNGAPSGPWTLRALRVNGVDRIDTGIDVSGGERLDAIELELTNRPIEISGTTSDAHGNPAPNSVVLLFPQDRDLWAMRGPERSLMARSDPAGRYAFRDVRPGRYYITAMSELDPSGWTDPDNLQTLAASAATIVVAETDKKTVDLPVRSSP